MPIGVRTDYIVLYFSLCITWINYLIVSVLFYYSVCVYLTSIKSRSGVSHMVAVAVGTVRGWFLLVWPCGFGLGDSWLDLRDVILASEVGTFWRRSRKTSHGSDGERGWVINYWDSSGKLGAAWCLVSCLPRYRALYRMLAGEKQRRFLVFLGVPVLEVDLTEEAVFGRKSRPEAR